uniref:Diaphonous n=6 Tax=Camaenidae TaxID=83226 RepID=A0A410SF40_9EUPU|nr:diaphonous [Bradybaena similaris]
MDNKKSFFDKVGGTLKLGGKSKHKHSAQYGSAKSLQSYEHGFNGSDPYSDSRGVSSMSSSEVKEMFERLLDDMNLTEEKKAPLRAKDTDFKRHMLTMQAKGLCKARGSELDSPDDFVHELMNADQKSHRRTQILEALKVSLTSKPVSWVMEFGDKGLNAILNSMASICNKNFYDPRAAYECVRCLKAFMNNTFGLKRILEHAEALSILSLALDHTDPPTMLEAVRCLAAICLVPPDGHDKVLGGITTAGDILHQDRFQPIIMGLKMRDNPAMQVACIQLVNVIVTTPDDLDFRLHLRNEFIRTGLDKVIESLSKFADEELNTQLHIFHEHRQHDSDEFMHRYDNVRLAFEDPYACFRLIMNTVRDTVAEPYFLSILQHLLYIRDDIFARPQYYKLIEECVTQIVLHRNGYDPDFRLTKRFPLEVEPLLSNLARCSKVEDTRAEKSIAEMTLKLEAALTAKQEAEAKAIGLEGKVQQYEMELLQLKEGKKQNIGDNISKALIRSPGNAASGASAQPPPAPPLPPLHAGLLPPPPPLPGMSPCVPAPPPLFAASPPTTQLPFGMAPKKKYSTNTQTKRLNWNKVNPKNLDKGSLWVNVREGEFESPEMFKKLEEMFSTKPPAKKELTEAIEKRPTKKSKELKVLDIKTGQNLSILLSSVKLSYEEIKQRILAVDEGNLTPGLLAQLIKCIPEPEVLKKLAALKDCYSDLAEPEQFAVVMSSIKRLVPRLSSILFKMRFPELVSDIKPDVVSATEALEEIKNSRRFAKLLELLLVMGNYLNAGSRNAQSVGFDVSFLSKLENTKSHDGNNTMLHFLAEILEKKYPDILGFLDETIHMDKAARISVESIQKNITSMGRQLKDLELDLRNLGKSADPNDKFGDVMKSFLKEAQSQHELLSAMYKKLENLYDNTAKYLAFDSKKYTMEEFFGDIKAFKNGLERALRDNAKVREFQEKNRRALEAREKSDKERREKKLCQAAILDMTTDETQEGVMDSLFEILKTGSAFTVTREKRDGRRRTPRAAGAERRAQLTRNLSKQNFENSALKEIKFEDSYNVSSNVIQENVIRENVKNKAHRRPSRDEESEAEKLLKRLKAL